LSVGQLSCVETDFPGDELLSYWVLAPGLALANAAVKIQEIIRHLISSFGLGLGVPVLWGAARHAPY
jgi:hypothetical protein